MDLERLKEWATPRQCEIIDAIKTHGSKAAAARALGIRRQSINDSIKGLQKRAARKNYAPDHGWTEPLPPGFATKRVSEMKRNADGDPMWVIAEKDKEDLADAINQAAKELSETLPRYQPRQDELQLTTDALSAYVIGDAHIGMLVQDHQNLNQGGWNLKTAENATLEAINHLINVSGGTDVALLVDVGDFSHADNSANISQSGHFHKTDGDFKDVITACVRIYRQAIEMMLDKHREVVVMIVRGNHNADSSLFMGAMLDAVYENEPRVTILDNRHKFMHYEYGNNFFGAHHGDRMKIQQAYEFFTRVFAQSWGRTLHRHVFMGHVHHQSAKEVGGAVFESFNVLASPDEWHSHSGYGSKRSMTSIIFDRVHGEIQRHKVGIKQIEGLVK